MMTSPEKNARVGFVILITHFNMALYSTCFWIQNGVMPYLSKKLGMDAVMFGYLQTTFAIVQLLGGPLFGRFGDLFGGRAALSLAYLSSSLTSLIMGLSTNVLLLFLSRLPSIFMHGMQAAQMVVTDLSLESERTGELGKLGLSYGVGMIIGSSAGGFLISKFGESFAAYVAAAGSVLNSIVVMKYIPEDTKSVRQKNKPEMASSKSVFNVKKIIKLLSIPGAAEILAVKAITGLPMGVFQSMFSVVGMDYFKLEAEDNGYLMAYVGVLQMALISNIFHFYLVCIPMSFGISGLYLTTNSILTKIVPPADTGAMLGLNMSVHSLIRSMAPTIGGFLYQLYGYPSFGYLQFAVNLLVFLYVFKRISN
ncbi:solute carrier family 22 member 18 isoform X2 [Hypanus sabinus]|uniref:solute carrier family 22 member 18 isoform X2 n=1 Tax=Hypanus sabinus TaxID=79690 RepID=UPI0028C432C4|nr:solute carrier family 22 member 18 isoform X2 [Hypanus sabinus]